MMLSEIVLWPSMVMRRWKDDQYLQLAVGLGAGLFWFGIPSADMDMASLAYWYGGMGVSTYLGGMIPGPNPFRRLRDPSMTDAATSAY